MEEREEGSKAGEDGEGAGKRGNAILTGNAGKLFMHCEPSVLNCCGMGCMCRLCNTRNMYLADPKIQ